MPRTRLVPLAGVALASIAAVLFLGLYGPARRSFAAPRSVVSVQSTEEIAQVLESTRVHGRVLICLTRFLNALESRESTGLTVTEEALRRGVVRKVFHVPPDAAWPGIEAALASRPQMRPSDEGFVGLFTDGRIYIQPLSRLPRIDEEALVLVEPAVWSQEELQRIAEAFRSGRISSDLIVVVRGTKEDAEAFRAAAGLAG